MRHGAHTTEPDAGEGSFSLGDSDRRGGARMREVPRERDRGGGGRVRGGCKKKITPKKQAEEEQKE